MIGSVNCVFCDFVFDMNLQSFSSQSRLKNPALDAGSLLNIGIYSIMWDPIGLRPSVTQEKKSCARV